MYIKDALSNFNALDSLQIKLKVKKCTSMNPKYLGCYTTGPGNKEIRAPCYPLSYAPSRVSLALLHTHIDTEYSTVMEYGGWW